MIHKLSRGNNRLVGINYSLVGFNYRLLEGGMGCMLQDELQAAGDPVRDKS